MQRPSSSSRVSRDHHAIDMSYQFQQQQQWKTSSSSANFRSKSPSSKSVKWLHIVPLILLLCLFVLWYFSHPVNLEIRDGRFTRIRRTQMPHSVDKTQVDLTILAKATSANVTFPEMLIVKTRNAPEPASGRD